MGQIALIIGNVYVYWSSVIRILAAAAAVCIFCALYLKKGGNLAVAAAGIPFAVIFSMVLARGVHWYFQPDGYKIAEAAWNPFLPGDYALVGVFAGCFLTAVILRITRVIRNLPELLDCMCIAGSLGIAVGRLSSWFDASDRGMIVDYNRWFPWVCSVVNPVSGTVEFRLATFMIQAAAAGSIFLILFIWYLAGEVRKNRRDGDAALIFLLCYGASQVLLDSTRYDSLYFRSNGFVSVVQVLSALAIASVIFLFAARLVSTTGWKKRYLLLWILHAGCFALAGYMEYYVQRHGSEAAFAYGVMGASLAVIVILTLLTRHLTVTAEKKQLQRMFAG